MMAFKKEKEEIGIEKIQVPISIDIVRNYITNIEKESIRLLLQRYNGQDVVPNGWEVCRKNDKIQVMHGFVEGSTWPTIRATGTLHIPLQLAGNILCDPKYIVQFDENMKSVQDLEQLSENSYIRLLSLKRYYILNARDLCVLTTKVQDTKNNRIFIASRSVSHPAAEKRKYTRAIAYISGYILTPDIQDPVHQTTITLVNHMDLHATIPTRILKHMGTSTPIKLLERIDEVAQRAVRNGYGQNSH